MELLNYGEYTSTLHEVHDATLTPENRDRLRDILGRELFIAFITTHGYHNLYFFNKWILGYDKMVDHLHRELCEFAEDSTLDPADEPTKRHGYIIPRGHYKSTCISIGKATWKGIRREDMRLAIFHEKSKQAEGFLGVISAHFQRNKLIRALYPERCPPIPIPKEWKWTKSEINLPREKPEKETTFSAHGVGSAQQGFHYTDMVWDDLIGEEAAGNADVMDKVIDWMTKGESLSVTPHTLLLDLIGTRWAMEDIYSWAMDNMTMEWFHRSAVIEDEGTPRPIFPEQFTMEILDELAKRDFFIFSCQYLNEPGSKDIQDFDLKDLRYYRKETRHEGSKHYGYASQDDFRPEQDLEDGAKLGSMVVLIHCDPGPGLTEGRAKRSNRHSKSAIMVVGLAYPRRVFLLERYCKRVAVDVYIDKICDYVEDYEDLLRWVTHEAHSWTRMVRINFIKRAQERGLPITEGRVKEYTRSASVAKETRIRGLQPWVKQGHLFIEHGQFSFEKGLASFPLGISSRDDLDALAQGPDYWDPFPEAPILQAFDDAGDAPFGQLEERMDPIMGLYGN